MFIFVSELMAYFAGLDYVVRDILSLTYDGGVIQIEHYDENRNSIVSATLRS